jgi:hypothetical protein
MALPNSENIISQLAKLPDQALKQMAMMHKADPYVLPLIISEDGRRKQVRQAAQAQMAGMQQPKVADAAVDQMGAVDAMGNVTGYAAGGLPEDMGIARLPARNIERMADGGIAGYDDGGMALAQHSEPVIRMADGGEVKKYAGVTGEQLVRTTDGGQSWWLDLPAVSRGKPSIAPSLANQKFRSKEEAIAAYNAVVAGGEAPAAPSATKDLVLPYGQSKATNVLGSEIPPAPAAPVAAPSAAPAPTPQPALASGAPTIKQAQDLGGKFYDMKGIKGTLEQQEAQERQDITNEKEARIARQAAFNKEQGPAMAGYEKLLKSEELQDTTDKEKAGLTALFKGFLAVAAGESPNAATNIAKGAMVGVSDYGDALKEFKKSARERNKAMASIEEARRADAKGDFKTVEDAETKANDYLRASKRHGIDAIINATGKSAELSAGIYKTLVDNASANARTNAQIAAPSGIERVVDRMAKDPKFAESYKNYASIGPEAKGIEAELQAYIKNPMMLKASNPELAAQFDAVIKQRMPGMLKPQSGAGSRD